MYLDANGSIVGVISIAGSADTGGTNWSYAVGDLVVFASDDWPTITVTV